MTTQKDPPVMTTGAPPGLTSVKDLTWTDKIVFIDGYLFDCCKFKNCELITFGGGFALTQCDTRDNTTVVRRTPMQSTEDMA